MSRGAFLLSHVICMIVSLAVLQEEETESSVAPSSRHACGQCMTLSTELDTLLTAVQLHQQQIAELVPSVVEHG
jgi:hypothetical protein